MQPKDVPAEMVERSARAAYYADPFYRSVFGKILEPREVLPWDELDLADIQEMRTNARHALAAVLPEIQAQALRDAADVVKRYTGRLESADGADEVVSLIESVIRHRAGRLTTTTEDRKTADEWCQILGVTVIDPDGWRSYGMDWSAPITEAEFHHRAARSTVARSTVTPITKTAVCKHCRRAIETTDPSKGWIHADGHNKHLGRCNSVDSGLPYGYNAEPTGEPCRTPCLGTITTEETT